MQLDIKRGHFKNIEDDKLEELMKEHFGNVEKKGDMLVSNFGAMHPITVKLEGKKSMMVEIETDKNVDDSIVVETIKTRNNFLFAATGLTSKERSKRLQKKAKKGTL